MMANQGMTKLTEECGELIVELAKKMALLHGQTHHWDDPEGLPVDRRVENEIGDVIGACRFVREKLSLSLDRIAARSDRKYQQYVTWDNDPNN